MKSIATAIETQSQEFITQQSPCQHKNKGKKVKGLKG